MNTKPQQPRERASVLIVDDHPMVRERLAQLVNEQPDLMVSGGAGDARQALAAIEAHLPGVILVDLSLKESSGMELIKDIHCRHPALPILVISMHEESVFAERALRAGARGYINKEEVTVRVVTAIRHVLSGEIWLSDRMHARIMRRLAGNRPMPATGEEELLSDREIEVFQMIGQGMKNQRIADALHIDPHTVETYRSRIKDKLNLSSSMEVLQHAVQWIQQDPVTKQGRSSADTRPNARQAGSIRSPGRRNQ